MENLTGLVSVCLLRNPEKVPAALEVGRQAGEQAGERRDAVPAALHPSVWTTSGRTTVRR